MYIMKLPFTVGRVGAEICVPSLYYVDIRTVCGQKVCGLVHEGHPGSLPFQEVYKGFIFGNYLNIKPFHGI